MSIIIKCDICGDQFYGYPTAFDVPLLLGSGHTRTLLDVSLNTIPFNPETHSERVDICKKCLKDWL